MAIKLMPYEYELTQALIAALAEANNTKLTDGILWLAMVYVKKSTPIELMKEMMILATERQN